MLRAFSPAPLTAWAACLLEKTEHMHPNREKPAVGGGMSVFIYISHVYTYTHIDTVGDSNPASPNIYYTTIIPRALVHVCR